MKNRRVRSDEITNYSYLFYLKFNVNLFETRSSSMYLYVLVLFVCRLILSEEIDNCQLCSFFHKYWPV